MWRDNGDLVTIVTIYSDERRVQEGRDYAEAMGCDYVGMMNVGSELTGIDPGEIGEESQHTLLRLFGEATWIMAPLGIQHPDHKAVAAICRVLAPEDKLHHYLEIPYYLKQSNQQEVNDKSRGKTVMSMLRAPARKWRHYTIFKSQSKFFHFNQVTGFYNTPEILLKHESD